MNAVEREPVETRVFNPTVSEASYKPKQRSFRATNLKKKVLVQNSPGTEMSGAETYPTRETSVSWHNVGLIDDITDTHQRIATLSY